MSDHWTTLLSGITAHDVDGGYVMHLNGDSHSNAIVDALAAAYRRHRPPVTPEKLLALVGTKVTLLRDIHGAFGHRELAVLSGTIHEASGAPAIVPKGNRTRGYDLSQLLATGAVLDVATGYGSGAAALADEVARVRAGLPQVQPLTLERLAALPAEGDDCTLAVFGTYPFLGQQVPGVVWLCRSYDAEDDIVDNVLLIRPEHGVSEHGSCYGRHLLAMNVGEIEGFPGLKFAEAIALTDAPYDDALTAVMSRAPNGSVPA